MTDLPSNVIRWVTAAILLILPMTGFGQATNNPFQPKTSNPFQNPVPYYKPPDPEMFRVEKKEYEKGIPGLSNYMDDLKLSNPGLHSKLMGPFGRLQSRYDWSQGILWGGAAVGLGVMAVGLFSEKTTTDGQGNQVTSSDEGLAIAGVAIGVTAMITSFIIRPSGSELDSFIRQHNEASGEKGPRIMWNLSLNPSRESAVVSVAYRFN